MRMSCVVILKHEPKTRNIIFHLYVFWEHISYCYTCFKCIVCYDDADADDDDDDDDDNNNFNDNNTNSITSSLNISRTDLKGFSASLQKQDNIKLGEINFV